MGISVTAGRKEGSREGRKEGRTDGRVTLLCNGGCLAISADSPLQPTPSPGLQPSQQVSQGPNYKVELCTPSHQPSTVLKTVSLFTAKTKFLECYRILMAARPR